VERDRRRRECKDHKEKHAWNGQQGHKDDREKRLLRLVGTVIVKMMSKYQVRMDIDMLKKHGVYTRSLLSLLLPFTWLMT
jgi:hypothetical protein